MCESHPVLGEYWQDGDGARCLVLPSLILTWCSAQT